MSITLDTINSSFHDIAVKDASSGYSLAIDSDGAIAAVVSATDLDIRDLDYNSDTVSAYQAGTWSVETTTSAFANWKVTQESVTSTESQLVSTPLTGRLKVLIQNLGTQDVYIKEATGVSTSNGLVIPKGSSYTEILDDGAAIYAITGSSTSDLRIVEYAA